MKRRRFLRTSVAAGAAAAGASTFGILKHPRNAHAAAWGAWPEDRSDLLIPEDLRVDKVLELHFQGGITPWETFYTVPTWGNAEYGYLNLFNNDPVNSPDLFNECGLDADGMPYTEFFAQDSFGQDIHFGPWTAPLRRRPDILARTRAMVHFHDVLAHEGANPVAFTGRAVGRPDLAGIGAHIQRYFLEQPGGQRAVPYSFLLFPTGPGFQATYATSATSIGFHPGSSRPLTVQLQVNSELSQLLERPGLDGSFRSQFDDAVGYYEGAFRNRLRPGGAGPVARSAELGNYAFANFSRRNAPELTQVLTQELFQPIAGQSCGGDFAYAEGSDMTSMQAEVARRLLTHPDTPARYVQWIDTGINPRPEVGHDVHNGHVQWTAQNVPHALEQLAAIVATPEQDAEAEGLIDLDNTLICINMEFGRTPYRQGDGDGTNHWPYGYVNLMIGGPIRGNDSRSPGSSIYGWISETGEERQAVRPAGHAQQYATPAENRMMLLAALGIYPFSSQSFAVADVVGAEDEVDAAAQLRDRLWGLDV